ncbi:MAG: PEP-CTERM sorting domain-containing protein [Patescibacteria group bacterium]
MKRLWIVLSIIASITFVGAKPASANSVTLYNFMPNPVPGNVVSEGYECCQIYEFGQAMNLAASGSLNNVNLSVLLSNWALASTYGQFGITTGFDVSMTANIYALNPGNTVGGVIGSVTTTQHILWRPESDTTCTGSSNPSGGWRDINGNCWSGIAEMVNFNFGSLTLPGSVAVGIAYNTFSQGYHPTGVHTGADSLNVGLNNGGAPMVGSNVAIDSVYLAGPGMAFGQQLDWGTYSPTFTLTADSNVATPEPASMVLLGSGLVVLAARFRRRKA